MLDRSFTYIKLHPLWLVAMDPRPLQPILALTGCTSSICHILAALFLSQTIVAGPGLKVPCEKETLTKTGTISKKDPDHYAMVTNTTSS